jgi:general stress protein YciG
MPALPGRGRLAANLAVGEPPAATVKKAAGTPVAPESAARRFALFHNRPSGKKKEITLKTSDEWPENIDAPQRPRRRRGFAGLDPERRSEIARQGGRAAHAMGRAHEFTPEEARDARAKSLRARELQEPQAQS